MCFVMLVLGLTYIVLKKQLKAFKCVGLEVINSSCFFCNIICYIICYIYCVGLFPCVLGGERGLFPCLSGTFSLFDLHTYAQLNETYAIMS